jgi:hypothetical protein
MELKAIKTTWIILTAACLSLAGGSACGDPATPQEAASIFESPVAPVPAGEIDRLVFAKLASLGIQPVVCSDAVFVRRVYLDVIGTLPTADEVRDFLADPDVKNKRRRLVDRLLERGEFADYWALKWGDVLRIKAEFPVNLWPNAAQAYHRWVRASIAENKPYDQFARELLTSSGSNFRVGPVNFYRAVQNRTPEGTATAVALTFMGARAEAWPKERLAGMAVFFAQVGYKPTREWKEEHVFWDPYRSAEPPAKSEPQEASPAAQPAPAGPPVATAPLAAVFPDGTKIQLSRDRDPREVFAAWLISPKNAWFARSIVNRVWAWLLGRGIIHEPDDIRDDNPPSNPELLAYLQKEFVAGRYDLKRLYRLILNSQTYQLSSLPAPQAASAGSAAEANFARYPLRRLDAEVLIDAVNKIAGTSDLYTSPIPEPFTYIPADMPAIAIADGSITSPFLAMFGRSARATGMASERNNKPTPAQWLHMLNSSQIQRKLAEGPKLRAIFESGRKPKKILDELYLTILSRPPTDAEAQIALEHVKPLYPKKPPAGKKPGSGKPGQGKKPGTADKQGAGKPSAEKSAGKPGTDKPAGKQVAAAKPGAGKPSPAAKPGNDNAIPRHDEWVDIAWALINSEEFLYRH